MFTNSLLIAFAAMMTTPINERTFAQLEDGMTEKHVVALLGSPGERDETLIREECPDWAPRTANCCLWRSIEGCLAVSFDENGKVVGKTFFLLRPDMHPVLDWLRRNFLGKERSDQV